MVKKLNNLPTSEDEFWLDGEKELIELRSPVKCDHRFEQIDRLNIKCVSCNMGLRLDHKDNFKDGHLYRNDQLVI